VASKLSGIRKWTLAAREQSRKPPPDRIFPAKRDPQAIARHFLTRYGNPAHAVVARVWLVSGQPELAGPGALLILAADLGFLVMEARGIGPP
jgi:hypothetical protein